MADDRSIDGYKPGGDFEEDTREPVLPISLSDSTELWLIQWPLNKLQPSDFHGKELTLKLHKDGKLASFENSSGKPYEVTSFAAQVPDATVFLPSSSESKIVGKISRRVSLVRYPEPGEFESRNFGNPNSSTIRLEGSKMRTMSHLTTISTQRSGKSSQDTLTSLYVNQDENLGTPLMQSGRNKPRRHSPTSNSMRSSAERSFGASEPESQMTGTTIGSMESYGQKTKKKKT